MCSWGVVGRWGSVGGAGRCVATMRPSPPTDGATHRATWPRRRGRSHINFPHQLPTHMHSFPVGPSRSSAPVAQCDASEGPQAQHTVLVAPAVALLFLAKGLAQRDTDKRPDRPNRTKQYYM